jgi:site-specific recombinase XerD
VSIPLHQFEADVKGFTEDQIKRGKAPGTIGGNRSALKKFILFMRKRGRSEISREDVLAYKDELAKTRVPGTVNYRLSTLNRFFSFVGLKSFRVGTLAQAPKTLFKASLTRDEYAALINTARSLRNERLYLLIRTLAATGLKEWELVCIRRSMLKTGAAMAGKEGKLREVLLPGYIRQELSTYCARKDVEDVVFHGNKPGVLLDKAVISRELHNLARLSGVSEHKVRPIYFRHYFAERFLAAYNNPNELADILGLSFIQTVRNYTRAGREERQDRLDRLEL